jgi:glycosyltransferase involved in cell wall biosynthesis
MKQIHKITILYTELADYMVACIRSLKEHEVLIQLIHWPINPEAPFNLELRFLDQSYSRDKLDDRMLENEIDSFGPDLILCSGWLDKGYVAVCRKWHGRIPTVVAFDNRWTGGFKQRIATLISPLYIQRSFSHAYVPGNAQKKYALKLGFKDEDVKLGFYTADVEKFNEYYTSRQLTQGEGSSTKRMLYLGRYVKHKGIFEMWDAFARFRREYPNWELWCVGAGDQYENRIEGEGIRHFGFVQPSQLLPILKETTVYILPSHIEPWGVSVQEMAIAGYPLLLSDKIGAGESFLVDEENGFRFEAGNAQSIQVSLERVAQLSDSELIAMAEKSHHLGLGNTPQLWARTLLDFLN